MSKIQERPSKERSDSITVSVRMTKSMKESLEHYLFHHYYDAKSFSDALRRHFQHVLSHAESGGLTKPRTDAFLKSGPSGSNTSIGSQSRTPPPVICLRGLLEPTTQSCISCHTFHNTKWQLCQRAKQEAQQAGITQ